MAANAQAPTKFLARLLTGLSFTNFEVVDPDAPDYSADITDVREHTVESVVSVPTGDTYRVTVEWLSERSP